MSEPSQQEDRIARARRRKRGLGNHLIAYLGVMVLAVPLNFFLYPEMPIVLLPMIGWGSVLAVHTAYAMGLLDGLFRGRKEGQSHERRHHRSL